jgi:hypothetical protein
MMEQACVGAASFQRHVEGFDDEMAIIARADGPPHHKPREQIENRRQIELPAAAHDEFGRVAHPALIGGVRGEVLIQHIRRDGWVMVAHRRARESSPHPRFEAFFLHEPHAPAPHAADHRTPVA